MPASLSSIFQPTSPSLASTQSNWSSSAVWITVRTVKESSIIKTFGFPTALWASSSGAGSRVDGSAGGMTRAFASSSAASCSIDIASLSRPRFPSSSNGPESSPRTGMGGSSLNTLSSRIAIFTASFVILWFSPGLPREASLLQS